METRYKDLSRILKVLAEPKRLEIMALLMQGVHCNCELGDQLNMAPNLISHHLHVLSESGLIEMERDPLDARWIYYSIDPTGVTRLLNTLNTFLDVSRLRTRSLSCGPGAKRLSDSSPIDALPAGLEVQP